MFCPKFSSSSVLISFLKNGIEMLIRHFKEQSLVGTSWPNGQCRNYCACLIRTGCQVILWASVCRLGLPAPAISPQRPQSGMLQQADGTRYCKSGPPGYLRKPVPPSNTSASKRAALHEREACSLFPLVPGLLSGADDASSRSTPFPGRQQTWLWLCQAWFRQLLILQSWILIALAQVGREEACSTMRCICIALTFP